MSRLIVISLLIVLALVFGLAMKSCQDSPTQEVAADARGTDTGIVVLPNGATMVAKQGTIGRELVDWLASDEHQRAFELGGQEFLGRDPQPTIESKARLPRLIAMLKAHPDVQIRVVGHSNRTDDPAADRALSETRARTVVRMLKAGGISGSRISLEGRGGDQPIGDDQTAEGRARNQRVSIVLTRDE